MNILMLSFSGADLSRLRALVTAAGKEIESRSPRTALDISWSRLVEILDLGAESEMRRCPTCHHQGALGASRCGFCWTSLPATKAPAKLAA